MKNLDVRFLVLGLAVAVTVAAARAADVGPQDASFAVSLESPPPPPVFFWQRFDDGFDNRANGVYADALQPLNVIRWNIDLRQNAFSENFREIAAARAGSAFLKSAQYGAREAFVEIPFMSWLDDHHLWLANFLRDSVDNVNEETATPLNASHEGVQQSWWREESASGMHYGVRPFSTSPYAYFSRGISDGEQTILVMHARYYYDRFANNRAELAFSVPLNYGVALELGSAYQFGQHDERRFAVKLVRKIKRDGIAHIGFEARQHPMLIGGITFAW